jgi:hypothetical protein
MVPMAWSIAGVLLSLALAVFALTRSRTPGGFYDAEIYGMTPVSHRRYALVAVCFALVFAATLALHAGALALWTFAAMTVVAVLYLSSFLRGFTEDDD